MRCSIFPLHLLPLFQRPLVFFRKPIPSHLYFNLEDALVFLPISAFQRKISVFHHLGVQSVSALLFTCSRNSLARDSGCHWPFIPSCFAFSESFRNLSLSFLQERNTPTFLVYTGLFPAFSIVCHGAPSFPRLPSTAKSSTAPDPVPSNFRCNTADTN